MSLLMPMITNVELFVPSRYRYKFTTRRRASWRRGERCQRTGVVARDAVWNIEKNECVVMKVMKVMRCGDAIENSLEGLRRERRRAASSRCSCSCSRLANCETPQQTLSD